VIHGNDISAINDLKSTALCGLSVDMARRGRNPKIEMSARPAWAQRIVRARVARKMSQAMLGEAIGASQSAIGDYETGKNEPPLATFQRLAKALRVTSQWLVFGQKGGFAESLPTLEDEDIPDITKNDEQFADVLIATKAMLADEKMPSDDRTAINLAQHLWRDIESLDVDKMDFDQRFQKVMDERRKVLRLARQLAFDPARH
jgi:transcriptional regulator with XRE-family HTH domain